MGWGGVGLGMMSFLAHDHIFDATEMMSFLAHEQKDKKKDLNKKAWSEPHMQIHCK